MKISIPHALAAILLFAILPLPLAVSASTVSGTLTGTVSTSYNWSGYAAENADYTAVAGSWTVPSTGSASGSDAGDAAWIGIGGLHSKDLIQTGTRGFVQNGAVSYMAWYELYPTDSVAIPLTVKPGDLMYGYIHKTGANVWQISLLDITSGKNYSTTVTFSSSESSAEWVGEKPQSSARANMALSNFGSISFGNMYAMKNGKAATDVAAFAEKLVLIDGKGKALLSPSALSSSGAAFSILRSSPSLAVR